MEEKKINATQQPEKMSYEQLENIAHQLSEQNKQFYQQLQQANMTNMFKRLDYLFQVIKYSNTFPKNFVDNCVTEVQELMTIPEETNEEKN